MLRLLNGIDLPTLDSKEQRLISELKNTLIDARLDIQDYELAETREFQLGNAKEALVRLKKVQTIISSNVLNVFGAVDVAHLVAQIEQIKAKLR